MNSSRRWWWAWWWCGLGCERERERECVRVCDFVCVCVCVQTRRESLVLLVGRGEEEEEEERREKGRGGMRSLLLGMERWRQEVTPLAIESMGGRCDGCWIGKLASWFGGNVGCPVWEGSRGWKVVVVGWNRKWRWGEWGDR